MMITSSPRVEANVSEKERKKTGGECSFCLNRFSGRYNVAGRLMSSYTRVFREERKGYYSLVLIRYLISYITLKVQHLVFQSHEE